MVMCPCLFLCCSFFKVQKLSYVKRRYHFLLRIALVESQPESTRLLQFPRRLGQSELSQSYRRYQDTNEFGFVETPSFFMCFYFSSKLNRPKILMVKKSFDLSNLFEKHSVMTIAASFLKGLSFLCVFRGPAVNHSFYGNERQTLCAFTNMPEHKKGVSF